MRMISVITLLTGWVVAFLWPTHDLATAGLVQTDRAQKPSPWAAVKVIVGGGVTPEYRPTDVEIAQLSLLGMRRMRLINIDSHSVGRDSAGRLRVEWSRHLMEGLRYCRDHGWVPRIIIGQKLPDSLMINFPDARRSDSTFWATYRQYVQQTVHYVVEEWGFRESEWEVGNEMDILAENWVAGRNKGVTSDSLRFSAYMQLYREISSVIGEYRRGHPTTILRIGGPAVTPGAFLNPQPNNNWTTRFVDEISRERSALACDFVSFHLYGNSASGREGVAALERLRARMAVDRISLPISVSEWGASWLGDANLNFEPVAGAFALDFVRVMAAAGIDDAFFLAVQQFPDLKWPVLFTATGSPTHTMLALRLLAEVHGSRAQCSLDRPGARCLAAISGDSMDLVFWVLDWEGAKLPDRQFIRTSGSHPPLVAHVVTGPYSLTAAKTTEWLVDGSATGESSVAIGMDPNGSNLTVQMRGVAADPGSYGRLRLRVSTVPR